MDHPVHPNLAGIGKRYLAIRAAGRASALGFWSGGARLGGAHRVWSRAVNQLQGEPKVAKPFMSGVRTAILVRFVPVDLCPAQIGLALAVSEYECAVTVGRLSLGFTPDSTDLVVGGQVVLYRLDEPQPRVVLDVVPELPG